MQNVIGTLIAVVVTLLLIVVAVVMGEQLINGSGAANAISEVEAIRNGVTSLYAGSPNFNGLSNKVLESGGQMPSNMISGAVGAGTDVDEWGGAVTVAPATNPAQFTVTFAGVPTSACAELGAYQAGNLAAVSINGTAVTLPISPATAVTDCNKSGEGPSGGNSIVWTFTG